MIQKTDSGAQRAAERPHGGGSPVIVKPTQTSQVLQRLRDEILEARIAPRERLVIANLAETFQTGQTPIREALMRLASEGLVVLENQRGFSVAPVSREDLIDLMKARCEIESLMVRCSIEEGDDYWEARLLGAFHRLQKCVKLAADGHSIMPDWESRHDEFHDALASGSPNKVLLTIRSDLFRRATRYRRLSVRYLRTPRDDLEEHRLIFEAALARDVKTAQKLICDHLNRTMEILLQEIQALSPASDEGVQAR